MQRWHIADANNRMYCNLTDGKKIAMPRYYKQKLYTDEQRQEIGEATRARMVEKITSKEKRSIETHRAHLQAADNSMALRSLKGDRF